MKPYKKLNFTSKLLLNYPLIWNLKLHYFIPISLLISLFLANFEFEIYQIESIEIFISTFSLFAVIYLFYTQRNNNKYKSGIELLFKFHLYIITIFFMVLPIYTIHFKVKNIVKQYNFTQEEYSIKYYYFENNQYKVKCKFNNKDKIYSYGEGDEICIGDKELFNNIVLSLTAVESVSEIEIQDIYDAEETMEYIENNENVTDSELISFLFTYSFLLILFQLYGLKKTIFSIFYISMLGVFVIVLEPSLINVFSIEIVRTVELFLFSFLTILYYLFKKSNLSYLSAITFWLMISVAVKIYEIFSLDLYIAIYISLLIIIIPMVKHIQYVQSKPQK